jgi:uncharacterized protein YlaN (UPF0358 family)
MVNIIGCCAQHTPNHVKLHLVPVHLLPQNWMFCEVLNTRLFKLSREQDPVLLSGGVSEESLTKTTQSAVLTAVALEGKWVTDQL